MVKPRIAITRLTKLEIELALKPSDSIAFDDRGAAIEVDSMLDGNSGEVSNQIDDVVEEPTDILGEWLDSENEATMSFDSLSGILKTNYCIEIR